MKRLDKGKKGSALQKKNTGTATDGLAVIPEAKPMEEDNAS